MSPIVVRSLNVGKVEELLDQHGRPFRSAVRKRPRDTAQFLGERGFEGDESFYDDHHGPNMQVHVFSLDRYPYYEQLAGKPLPVPTFGENLSVSGGIETEVCIGDLFEVGTALVEVSQPTERCGTPGRSVHVHGMKKWSFESLYTGYYLRVIRPGWVRVHDELRLMERHLPEWTVERVSAAMVRHLDDESLFREIEALPLLSDDWKARMHVLRQRLVTRQGRPAS
ncbi:MAG TPA: MOSC domain-containing protein [Candidatus Elarobacter sp.]|nr:MOSC domain-containing protein [Candidatus Elarobacter sp.]